MSLQRDWELRNPEKVREYAERRAERIRASHALAREILRRETLRCSRCEEEVVWPQRLCDGCRARARAESERRRYSTGKYTRKTLRARAARIKLVGTGGANNRITSEFLGWPYGCAWCGVRGVKLEVDHIVPISMGGKHHISNVVFACRSCNARKGARVPQDQKVLGNPNEGG